MDNKYVVRLSDEERSTCETIIKKLKGSSERFRRAQILLKADADGPGSITSFEGVHLFATCRKEWLQTILTLPNDIPSHDTIYRVFTALDHKVFAKCFST